MLNELNETGKHMLLNPKQLAAYLHVDDAIFMTTRNADPSCNEVMEAVANAMEEVGFLVPEQTTSDKMEKVVGYAPTGKSFKLPLKKLAALNEMANCRRLDVNLLRVVTGIRMHGAQLRRDVMSVPFTALWPQ